MTAKFIQLRRIPSSAVIVCHSLFSGYKGKAQRVLFLAGFFLVCVLPLFAQAPAMARDAAPKDKLIEKALVEYRRGNTPNALDRIYKVLEKYPKNARAIDLYNQINADEAKRLCRAAEIYFRNGETDLARAKIGDSRALSVDVFLSYVEEKVIEAKSYLANQNPVMCGESVAEILFFDPRNNEALKLKALLESSFFKELYNSVKREKQKLSSRKYLEAQKLSSNPVKALALANYALKLDPSNAPAAKFRKKMLNKLAKEEESGLDKSEKQRAKDKHRATVYFLKAEKYYKKRKFEKAFKYFEKAAAKDPSLEKAKKMKDETGELICTAELSSAFGFLASGKKRAASRCVKKARRYDPAMVAKKAEELIREAGKLTASGDKKGAGISFQQASLLNPGYEDAKNVAGASAETKEAWKLYRAGNYARCDDIISSAARQYPGNIEIMFLGSMNSAQLALDKGDFLETRKFLLRAVKLKPLHGEVWDFFNRMEELLNILGYEPERENE